MRLEHKAEGAGLLAADDDEGVVEAIVSVTGVVDSDGDIIEPGAYADTLKRRTPKGIFSHDWKSWASRTEVIEEWLPGDPRLPKQTRDGRPWPSQAGALYVKTRYNLATTAGREAFESVKFYGPECEWSIGYRVPKGKAVRGKDGVRHIKGLDLFEYCPVLFGANSLSGTLSLKSVAADVEVEGDEQAYEPIGGVQPAEAAQDAGPPPAEAAQDAGPPPGDEKADGGEADGGSSAGDGDTEAAADGNEDGEGDDTGEAALTQEELNEIVAELDEWASAAGEDEAEGKGSRASLDRSPRKNWVEMSGELPGYVREIARSIHEKRGVPLSRAIPIAIGTIKRWCEGGGDVNADTRAKACKAVAEWEALKGKNRARAAAKTGEDAVETVDSVRWPFIPGTFEELRDVLREQAVKALEGGGVAHVEILGTWPDRAVVAAYAVNGKAATYEVPYAADADGEVSIGDPEPVEVKVSTDGGEVDGADLLPYPAILDEVTAEVKALLSDTSPAVDGKAGRVLSGVNATRLLAAVEQLVAVLEAAGLHVSGTGHEHDEDGAVVEPQQVDSTAPSATKEINRVVLDPGLLAQGYRLLSEMRG